MPIVHAVWKVQDPPQRLREVSLGNEALLEQMIATNLDILNDRWLLIGRQVRTRFGGCVDLIGLNADAQLILIELKRAQTPREVVAQAIDYASWAKDLSPSDLAEMYAKFVPDASLSDAFEKKFGISLDEEELNGSHQIVIVASSLDASTERIVNYLNEMNVAINVILFQVFEDEGKQLLSRAWLIDPIETETRASATPREPTGPWNGEWYVSFGHGMGRDWNDAMKYGFISGGGGSWFTRTLNQLSPGDRIWVKAPGYGYVGVGRVTGQSTPARDFRISVNGVTSPALDVLEGDYQREFQNDEKSEYFVPVEWIHTRPLEQAVSEIGLFGNQNTACKPVTAKWNHTVDRLKHFFGVD